VARDIFLALFGDREKVYMTQMKRLGLLTQIKTEDGVTKWMYTDRWSKSDTVNNPVETRMSM
jgi:hypothetical protein